MKICHKFDSVSIMHFVCVHCLESSYTNRFSSVCVDIFFFSSLKGLKSTAALRIHYDHQIHHIFFFSASVCCMFKLQKEKEMHYFLEQQLSLAIWVLPKYFSA